MASTVPPKKNTAYTFEVALVSQADTDVFKSTPTLAAGDVQVSLDGATFANIGTLPTEIHLSGGVTHSGVLSVALTAGEMNADRICVLFHDAAGDEWQDLVVTIETSAQLLDDIAGLVDDLEARLTAVRAGYLDNLSAGAVALASGVAVTSVANDAITAASIAANAIGSSELATTAAAEIADAVWDEILAGHLGAGSTGEALNSAGGGLTVAAIADGVWDELVAGHVGAGSFGEILGDVDAEVWTYATRTLTTVSATTASSVSGSTITITRGDTLSAALTGLGTLVGYVSIDWTVKHDKEDSDNDAILRIRLNATGLNDGLLRVNGAAAASDLDGSITVDNAVLGNITIAVAASVTDDLVAQEGLFYDVQLITAAGVTTKGSGMCNVAADVTMAVV